MRRRIKKLAVKVQNGEASYKDVENMFKGWMGSFYKLMSRKQRSNLIELFESLFDKSIIVDCKKLIINERIAA